MDKEQQTQLFQVAGVIAFALILLVPVLWYANKAKSPERAITQEQLDSFKSDEVEVVEHEETSYQDLTEDVQMGEGMRSKFSNVGSAIVSVNINNIVMMSPKELESVGATPFSLMNTVRNNLQTPQVIEVVFDNADVLKGFSSRQDVHEWNSNYFKLYDLITSQSYALDKFVNNPAVQGVLKDERLLRSLLKSKIITFVLSGKTAQYLLSNPARTKDLIASNQTLAPYLDNQTLKKVLMELPSTRKAAAQIFN